MESEKSITPWHHTGILLPAGAVSVYSVIDCVIEEYRSQFWRYFDTVNDNESVCRQVKGTFTRTYNKTSCPLPYATASMSKKKRKRQNATEDDDVVGVNDDGGEFAAAADSEESDDDDIAADSMIKVTFHLFLVPDSCFALLCTTDTKLCWPMTCKHM